MRGTSYQRMPTRVSKAQRESDKKKALNTVSKIDIQNQIDDKKQQLKEVETQKEVERNRIGSHRPTPELMGNRRYQEVKEIKENLVDDITILESQLNSIRNPQSEKRKSVLNAGISITENPFDDERQSTSPITAQGGVEGWSLSGNPDFITGESSFNFDEDKEEILRRRQGRSQNNMQSIVDPMIKPRLQVAGREPQPMTTDEYQEEERRILHNENLVARQIDQDRHFQRGINPRQYVEREQDSNPILETLDGINQVSQGLENVSSDGVRHQDFGQSNNSVDRLQNAFLSNLSLATIIPTRATTTFNQKKEEKPKSVRVNSEDELPRFGDSVSNTEMQAGLFVQGMSQSFASYSNLIQNAYNFATGKEQVAMKEKDIPIQDRAIGGFIKSMEDSRDYNIPFSVALQDN